MTRRIIAALIALSLNGGDYSPLDSVADDTGDDDAGDRPHVFIPPAGPAVRHREKLGRRPGAVATRPPVLLSSPAPHVGRIAFTARVAAPILEDVLAAALSVCRERGDLKVQVEPGPCDTDRVRLACESHGFTFSRHRRGADGRPVVEFYTDLYYRPGGGEPHHDPPSQARRITPGRSSLRPHSASAHTRGGSPSSKNSTWITLGLQQTGQSST
jgi:hypothetical protein